MIDLKNDLSKIFGPGNVLDDPQTLDSFSRDESFTHPFKPRSVVKPQNISQIKTLVQWANQTLTPLVPISSGPPHFRGDTVPSSPGAIMVDLSSLQQIIHIEPRNRMVILEPGVTYTRLQLELAKAGLRLSSPLAPRANKSVIASLLEREPILIPRYQWNLLDPLRCLEVTWGDGQRMTTGETSGVLEEEWLNKYAQVAPAGPGQTDFYRLTSAAQGSMGIVTWASLKCEVLSQIHMLYFVPAKELKDLLDLTYAILRIRFGDELLILNNFYLACLLGQETGRIKALAEQLPSWLLLVGIAGRDRLPEERASYQEKDISEMTQRYGLQFVPAVPGASSSEVLAAILNPSGEPYWKLGFKGACQDIFFLNTLEHAPEFVTAMHSVAAARDYPTSEIGVYVQPVHQGASCHIEFALPFNRNNLRELSRMQTLYTEASEAMLKQGAYYSRPYGIWADMAYNRDARTTLALKKIKGIFDPHNVMNPGKLCF